MKRVLIPVLAILLFACKKDDEPKKIDVLLPATETNIQGSWKLFASYASAGGPVEWIPAKTTVYISFYQGSYNATGSSANHYILTNTKDTILKTYKQGNTDTVFYAIKVSTDTLNISIIGCIEGCGEKYVRGAPLGD